MSDLVLDYGYARPLKNSDILWHGGGLAVAALLIGVMWLKRMSAALPLLLAVLMLAPTTLVPIVSEVGAERRMYMPSLAIISAIAVYVSRHLSRSLLKVAGPALIIVLALPTVQRNAEYASTCGMWKTVADRRPHGRAYLNLAVAAQEAGRTSEVLPLLQLAAPDFPDAEFPLGERLYQERKYAEAISHLENVLRLRATHRQAEAARQLLIRGWTDLAIERSERADVNAAHDAFVRALELDPNNPDLQRNVAISTAELKQNTRERPR